MEFFISKLSQKLDPDIDLWDCLGKVKLILWQNFIGLIKLFVVILERGNSQINTLFACFLGAIRIIRILSIV